MGIKSLSNSSGIVNFQKHQSMLAGIELNKFHHLETVRLGSSAASVEFINLGQYSDYQHLQIRAIVSHTNSGGNALTLRLNNDTGNNYSYHELVGNSSAVVSNPATSQSSMLAAVIVRQNLSNTSFGAGIVDILDAFDTTKNPTIRALSGHASTESAVGLTSAARLNVEAITSIQLSMAGGSIGANSRISLYGLKVRA